MADEQQEDDAAAPEVVPEAAAAAPRGAGPAEAQASPASQDRKTAARFLFRVPVDLEVGRETGQGRIHDMSQTGARVEESTLRPDVGAKLRLRFRFYEHSPPIAVQGKVVRTTETGGFAVTFVSLDARTRAALSTLLPRVGSGRWRDARDGRSTGDLSTPLGPELYARCVEAARNGGVDLNRWVVAALERAVEEADRADPPV